MNKRLLSLLLVVPILAACNGQNSSSSVVKEDVAITDEDFLAVGHLWGKPKMMKDKGFGDPVELRGTNIGSLFVQENWMTLTNASCQIDAINILTSRFGREKAWELLTIYEENFWTDEDWDNCVELGINHIRLPITYMNVWEDIKWILV